MAFIAPWNQHVHPYVHPYNWTSKPVAKIMAKCELKITG